MKNNIGEDQSKTGQQASLRPAICSEIRAKAEVFDQIRGQITTWLKRSNQYVEEADRDGNVEDRGIHLRVSSVLRELDRLADAFLETERKRQETLSQNDKLRQPG